MFGVKPYGDLLYGTTPSDLEGEGGGEGGGVSPEDQAVNLMPFLPYYYQKSYEVQSLQHVLSQRLYLIGGFLKDVYNQHFVHTATWGLDIYEHELGINRRQHTIKDRREYILAKLKGRGVTTVDVVKDVGETFFGEGNVEVIEHTEDYHFELNIIEKDVPIQRLRSLFEILDEIKPAHLTYEIDTRYSVWGDLLNATWGDLQKHTWREVRIYKDL